MSLGNLFDTFPSYFERFFKSYGNRERKATIYYVLLFEMRMDEVTQCPI